MSNKVNWIDNRSHGNPWGFTIPSFVKTVSISKTLTPSSSALAKAHKVPELRQMRYQNIDWGSKFPRREGRSLTLWPVAKPSSVSLNAEFIGPVAIVRSRKCTHTRTKCKAEDCPQNSRRVNHHCRSRASICGVKTDSGNNTVDIQLTKGAITEYSKTSENIAF